MIAVRPLHDNRATTARPLHDHRTIADHRRQLPPQDCRPSTAGGDSGRWAMGSNHVAVGDDRLPTDGGSHRPVGCRQQSVGYRRWRPSPAVDSGRLPTVAVGGKRWPTVGRRRAVAALSF